MKKIPISLTEKQKTTLKEKRDTEKLTKRQRDRIDILLLCDRNKKAKDIADFLDIGPDKIWRVKRRFLEGGLDMALSEDPRPGQPKKYTPEHETTLVALACSETPEGRSRWTIELLTEALRKEEKECSDISKGMVRLMLKKTNTSLGGEKCGVSET